MGRKLVAERLLADLAERELAPEIAHLAVLVRLKPAVAAVVVLIDADAVFADKPRWLVLNKMDTLTAEDGATLEQNITAAIGWQGPVYCISAETGMGTEQLCHDIMQALERLNYE